MTLPNNRTLVDRFLDGAPRREAMAPPDMLTWMYQHIVVDRAVGDSMSVLMTYQDGQVQVTPVEVSYQQAILTRNFQRDLDAVVRELYARLEQYWSQQWGVAPVPLEQPCDATDELPDHCAMPMDEFTAHVDAVLADCARWLAEVQEGQGEGQ